MTHTPSGTKTVQSLMDEFDSIDAYLQAVHEIVQDGHMPDIAGLDERIAHLCEVVDGVDPDIQGRCLIKLDKLMNKLDACENEMTALHKTQMKSNLQ